MLLVVPFLRSDYVCHKFIILGATLAAVFVFAMMANPVFAAGDPKKITSATADGDTITITTAGKAGAVVPDPDKIFGYVAITDAGAFIVASHNGIDDDDATGDHDWHSHSFTLDENGCVATIDSTGTATISGNTITISGTGASTVDNAFFVMLKISDAGICVQKVF